MRRVFGCTLAVLFSATCAHAQPKEHARDDHAADVHDEAEIDYSELAQAEIRKAAADRSMSLTKWEQARAFVEGGARDRMTAKVSAMMGLVPAEVQEPIAAPAHSELGIVDQVELPERPSLNESASLVGARVDGKREEGKPTDLSASVERIIAQATQDVAMEDSEFVRSGM